MLFYNLVVTVLLGGGGGRGWGDGVVGMSDSSSGKVVGIWVFVVIGGDIGVAFEQGEKWCTTRSHLYWKEKEEMSIDQGKEKYH